MHTSQRVDFLRRAALFAGLDDDDLAAVAAKLSERSYVKGAAVFRAGDPGASVFLLVRGKVAIRDDHRHLVQLTPGECFGELAALTHDPRSADAICEESCELLELTSSHLLLLMSQSPELQRQVMRVLVERVKEAGRRSH